LKIYGDPQNNENSHSFPYSKSLTFKFSKSTKKKSNWSTFTNRRASYPGKPSSDTHDQIRKIILKTTTAKTTSFNRKKFGICLREKTMIDYVICTVIPKVIITWYHTCHTVGLTGCDEYRRLYILWLKVIIESYYYCYYILQSHLLFRLID
jgi:hypothetical protein